MASSLRRSGGQESRPEVSTSKVTLRLRPHLQPDKPIVTANKTILIFFSKWQRGCGSYWSGSSTYHSPNLQCADAKVHVSGLNYAGGLYMVPCLAMLLLHCCVWLPPAPFIHMLRKSFYCSLIFNKGNTEAPYSKKVVGSILWVVCMFTQYLCGLLWLLQLPPKHSKTGCEVNW